MLRPTLARDSQRPFKSASYILSHLSGRGSCIIEKWKSDGVDQISPQSSTIPMYSCIYRVYTSICRWVYCTVLFIESMASVCAQAPPHSEGIHEFLPRRVKAAFPPRCSQAWCLSLHSTIFYLQPHIFAVHNAMYIQMYMTSFQVCQRYAQPCPPIRQLFWPHLQPSFRLWFEAQQEAKGCSILAFFCLR